MCLPSWLATQPPTPTYPQRRLYYFDGDPYFYGFSDGPPIGRPHGDCGLSPLVIASCPWTICGTPGGPARNLLRYSVIIEVTEDCLDSFNAVNGGLYWQGVDGNGPLEIAPYVLIDYTYPSTPQECESTVATTCTPFPFL
jgi:hypothetical protein